MPLAPGVSIVADEAGTLTALLTVEGEPHALTCAHIFGRGDALFADNRRVGTLRLNLRRCWPWVDAALVRLNEAGRAAIDTGHNQRWWTQKVRSPVAKLKDRRAFLLQRDATRALPVEIRAHRTRVAAFAEPRSPIKHILTEGAGVDGDSGAPLYVKKRGVVMLLGIHVGPVGGRPLRGCHVPVRPVIEALRAVFRDVRGYPQQRAGGHR